MDETEPRWSIKKTERMLVVNFWVAAIVMVLCLAMTLASWKRAAEFVEVTGKMQQIESRVVALEQEKNLHKQPNTQQPLQQPQSKNQE